MKVRFGDVVIRANTKEDKDNTEKKFYLDGQFFEGEELEVEKGSPLKGATIGPMFYFGFKSGQVLFMSRSFAIKKAAVARFDGICSEKTFVLETKDENVLLQDYLVFVLQSPSFWDYCEKNKSGSVNFFINWSTLAKYEFDLPPIGRQLIVSKQLWAAYAVKKSYRRMISSIDEMVKSQFIEMFGDPIKNTKQWRLTPLSSLGRIDRGVSKARPRNAPDLLGGPYPLVQTGEVANCETYITSFNSTYSEKGLAQSKIWPAGTLCITIAANIAKTGILAFDACFPDSVVGFIPYDGVDLIFVHHWFRAVQQHLEELAPSTAQKNMNLAVLSHLMIITPPLIKQQQFSAIVNQADKSKFELKQAIDKIDRVMRALMQ